MKLFETIPDNLIESQDFLLGFEVEMIYDGSKIGSHCLDLELHKINQNIILGDDGTVIGDGRLGRSNEYSCEIKTPPLLPKQSLEVLQKVFELVNKYGYTNHSCGFHLNFSPISENLYNSIDPFRFTLNDLWMKIKKDFSRDGNRWCGNVWPQGPQERFNNKLNIFKALQGGILPRPIHGKSADVNFQNYFSDNKSRRRIEIRAFGGESYHQKFDKIMGYTNDIFRTFLNCCEA